MFNQTRYLLIKLKVSFKVSTWHLTFKKAALLIRVQSSKIVFFFLPLSKCGGKLYITFKIVNCNIRQNFSIKNRFIRLARKIATDIKKKLSISLKGWFSKLKFLCQKKISIIRIFTEILSFYARIFFFEFFWSKYSGYVYIFKLFHHLCTKSPTL